MNAIFIIWFVSVSLLAMYGAFASYRNEQGIKAIMKHIEEYEQMVINELKK